MTLGAALRRREWANTVAIFLTVLALDVTFEHSTVQAIDGVKMLKVTQCLLDHGLHLLGKCGTSYGIGSSIVAVPTELIERAVGHPTGWGVVSLSPIVMTALTAAVLFRIGLALGWVRSIATVAALIYAFLTMAISYSSLLLSEVGVTESRWERASRCWVCFVGDKGLP